MGEEDLASNATALGSPSAAPDTEPSSAPTSTPAVPATETLSSGTLEAVARGAETLGSQEVDVSVHMESSVNPAAAPVHAGTSDFSARPDLTTTARSNSAPRASHRHDELPDNSNTTLQSMLRPDSTPEGVPHTRRFLRIENELDQANAALKLLEKGLISAQKEARIAWILATCALLAAAAAVAL